MIEELEQVSKSVKNNGKQYADNEILSDRDIVNVIQQVTGVAPYEMKCKTRKTNVVFARHLCFYFLKECTDLSLREIGEMFGGRDHSTVINGKKRIQELIDVYTVKNPRYRKYDEVRQNILAR